ncbi:MAG: hypothetical protein K6C94_00575 [Candidatus Gastranaerophilales bacterium]|nr:hypothetical protein [Candidatus Gastranaerophilales bacterium]
MSNKTSEIIKKINKKIDEITENKEVSEELKAEIKELAGMVKSEDLQEQLETINSKLEKLETGNSSLSKSVHDFVSSSSKTLETITKSDTYANDSEQAEQINVYIKSLEKKIDKLIKKHDTDGLNADISADDFPLQKLKSELTFFQNAIEERLNKNSEDLGETVAQIIVSIKDKITEFQDYYENNAEKILTDIISDVKQIKADFNELYDTVKSIDKQSIYETEKNVKKILANKQSAEEDILSQIEEVKNITAKSAVLDARSKEAVETFKSELTQLKNNIHNQIRDVLSKIVIQDEIKFLCEEAITGIKNTNSETGVLRKYLKDIKSDDERHAEQIEEIKNIILDLSDYEMNESSDKIDIIYENMSMLNSWADSSDKMIKHFDDLNVNFDNLGGYFDDLRDDFNLNADKIDIIYENLSFINEWVKKLDEFAKNVEAIKAGYDSEANLPEKIEEITTQIALVKEWNKKADALALQVRALSVQISETESTVNSKNLADMKTMFAQMSDDMASLSSRTNKMILESDKTNDTLKENISNLQSIIGSIGTKTKDYTLEELKEKIDDVRAISVKSSGFGQGLTESFMYLAEWIDSAGSAINSIRTELDVLKEQQNDSVQKAYEVSEKQQIALENIQNFLSVMAEKQKENEISVSLSGQESFTENSNTDTADLGQKIDAFMQYLTARQESEMEKLESEQVLTQKLLNDIKEYLINNIAQTPAISSGITADTSVNNEILQNIQVILNLLQQKGLPSQIIEEKPSFAENTREDKNNAEIKKMLDFIAAQVVNTNENNAKTDLLARRLDSIESKISNLEQYMARLIDYLDED